jgi:hypothetical protein
MAGNFNSGRRPMKTEIKTLLESEAKKSLYAMISIRDSDAPAAVRMDAAQYICDRAWGKPHQSTELTGADLGPVLISVVYRDRERAEKPVSAEEKP